MRVSISQSPHSASLFAHTRLTLFFFTTSERRGRGERREAKEKERRGEPVFDGCEESAYTCKPIKSTRNNPKGGTESRDGPGEA
jgi:hypothetical protein